MVFVSLSHCKSIVETWKVEDYRLKKKRIFIIWLSENENFKAIPLDVSSMWSVSSTSCEEIQASVIKKEKSSNNDKTEKITQQCVS